MIELVISIFVLICIVLVFFPFANIVAIVFLLINLINPMVDFKFVDVDKDGHSDKVQIIYDKTK